MVITIEQVTLWVRPVADCAQLRGCPATVPAPMFTGPVTATSTPVVVVPATLIDAVMMMSAVVPVRRVTVGFVPGEPPSVAVYALLPSVPAAL